MPLLAVLILATQAVVPGPSEPFTAVCTYVYDGDTIAVRLEDGRELRVRYAGIDTPERDEAGGRRAQALNRALVLDRQVHLTPVEKQTDPYGRLVATPRVCDIDVEGALLAAGLARRWRRN